MSLGPRQFSGENEGRPEEPQKLPRIQLNAAEKRAIQECNRESFWYRCVPLSVLFVGSVQILASKGMISTHPKYGALFKNFGAGLAAYLLGKVSYQGVCRDKILSLEDSPLADAMRKGKRGMELFPEVRSRDDYQVAPAVAEDNSLRDNDRSFGEINTDSNVENKGFDDYESQSSTDRDGQDVESTKPSTSYSDLRTRNRSSYEERNAFPPPAARRPPPTHNPDDPAANPRPKYNAPAKRARRNQYGDIIEE